MRGYDEQFQINNFENLDERVDITKIRGGYGKQLNINKLETLCEMDKSLK